jgi:hypothetical protein
MPVLLTFDSTHLITAGAQRMQRSLHLRGLFDRACFTLGGRLYGGQNQMQIGR